MAQSSSPWSNNPQKEEDDLKKLLDSYKDLLENQSFERNMLLEKVNEITNPVVQWLIQ